MLLILFRMAVDQKTFMFIVLESKDNQPNLLISFEDFFHWFPSIKCKPGFKLPYEAKKYYHQSLMEIILSWEQVST